MSLKNLSDEILKAGFLACPCFLLQVEEFVALFPGSSFLHSCLLILRTLALRQNSFGRLPDTWPGTQESPCSTGGWRNGFCLSLDTFCLIFNRMRPLRDLIHQPTFLLLPTFHGTKTLSRPFTVLKFLLTLDIMWSFFKCLPHKTSVASNEHGLLLKRVA